MVAHTTLLEISCRYSYVYQSRAIYRNFHTWKKVKQLKIYIQNISIVHQKGLQTLYKDNHSVNGLA